jgi:hypothetical protein
MDDLPVLVEALVRQRFQQTVPLSVMRLLNEEARAVPA